MTELNAMSETDLSNSSISGANVAENCAMSGLNDAIRGTVGMAKRAYDRDHAGAWVTVGGTANAITLAYSVGPAAYVTGEKFAFLATASNTGATTVNVSGLGSKNILKKSATGLTACLGSEILSGDLVEIEYDGTQFQLMGTQSANDGGVIFHTGTTVTVVNTTATTNIISLSIPGGLLGINRSIRLGLTGAYTNSTGGASTFQVQVTYGGTVIADTTAASMTQNAATRSLNLDVVLSAAAGSTGNQATRATFTVGPVAGDQTVAGMGPPSINLVGGNNLCAVDSTVAQTLLVRLIHGTASASISAAMYSAYVVLI